MRRCNLNDLKYFEQAIKDDIKTDVVVNIERYICLDDPQELKISSHNLHQVS